MTKESKLNGKKKTNQPQKESLVESETQEGSEVSTVTGTTESNSVDSSKAKLVLPELEDAHYAAFGIVYCSPKYHVRGKDGTQVCDNEKLDKEYADFINVDVEVAKAVRNKIASETPFLTEWVTQDINSILNTIGGLK